MKNILLFVTIMALLTTILGVTIGNQYALALGGTITPKGSVNDTMSGQNVSQWATNATLAFAQEQVSIAPGSSNPSAAQFYVPPAITISSGTTVTWTNNDATIHTVTEGSPQVGTGATPAFDSSIIAPTAIWKNIFDTAGEFNYYCSLHPFMTGKVTVP